MARTFNKMRRTVEKLVFCSLIALAVPLNAQTAAKTTWTAANSIFAKAHLLRRIRRRHNSEWRPMLRKMPSSFCL